jgi:hypothetical protein
LHSKHPHITLGLRPETLLGDIPCPITPCPAEFFWPRSGQKARVLNQRSVLGPDPSPKERKRLELGSKESFFVGLLPKLAIFIDF